MTKRVQEATARDNKVRAALVSWIDLNELIGEMDEEDVLHAMRVEKEQANRPSFIRRLTQRLTGIRIAQVKEEIEDEEVTSDRPRRSRRRN